MPVTTVFFVTSVTTCFFEIFGIVKAVPKVGADPTEVIFGIDFAV
jgi:hypothetical protein